jgi:hypothetical protein
MLQKTLFRFSTLILVVTFALLASCTNTSDSNPNSRPSTTAGSAANPQTAMKKQTGGS